MFRKNKKRCNLKNMAKKSEKELLEQYLKQELDKLNISNFKGNPQGLKGFPDRVVYGDVVYYIELKLGKENQSYYGQTKTQSKWQKQIEQTKSDKYFLLSTREQIDGVVKEIHKKCVENNIQNHFAFDTKIE